MASDRCQILEDETVGALKRELAASPELFFSTRTTSAPDEIYGRRSAELESFDEASNTLACTWTTGAAVLRLDSMGLYNEVLDLTSKAVRLARLNAGASFLNSPEDLAQVLGAVVRGSAKIEGGKGICRVLLSKAAGCADIIGNIKAGVIRNVSVGYLIHGAEWSEGKAGVPTCRVVDWEPIEISAVAVPADPGAQLRLQTAPRMLRDQASNAILARVRARARRLGIW